jgi:hypothetical protein
MNSKHVSLAIGRRQIALALFSGQELECWQLRNLPNNVEQAKVTVAAFVRRAISHFDFGSAAIQSGSLGTARKDQLLQVICEVLREQGIPILTASENELFAAFRHPIIVKRGDLRKIVRSVFPQLGGEQDCQPLLDAAALGLYLETERVLTNH